MYKYIFSTFLFLIVLFSGCKTENNKIDNTLNTTNRPAEVIEAEDTFVPHWVK